MCWVASFSLFRKGFMEGSDLTWPRPSLEVGLIKVPYKMFDCHTKELTFNERYNQCLILNQSHLLSLKIKESLSISFIIIKENYPLKNKSKSDEL